MNKGTISDIKKTYSGLKNDTFDSEKVSNPCYIFMEDYRKCMKEYSQKGRKVNSKLKECNGYFENYNVCLKQHTDNIFSHEIENKKLDASKIQAGRSPNKDLLKEMEENQKKEQTSFEKKYKKKI